MILAQVELADECDDEEHGQRAVDANEQVSHCVQSAKLKTNEELIHLLNQRMMLVLR